MLAIVGLGNPSKYTNTWHNLGKEFCNFLTHSAKIHCTHFRTIKNKARILKCYYLEAPQKNFLIIIPVNIYMNNIGYELFNIIRQLPIKTLIIAHDDLSIPLGHVKLTPKQNINHNGVKSFAQYKNNFELLFLRFGALYVSHNDQPLRSPRRQVVLQRIPDNAQPIIQTMFQEASTNLIYPLVINPDLVKRGYLQKSE